MFAVGTLLAGKYRVDRIIGQGGMGVVVGATHMHLQQPVALKFLLPELAGNQQLVERFVREARASAQLRGEHVCRVSDVGMFENGAPYIVMELLEGRDLASMIDVNGPMPVPIACDYVLQACVGIAEAHAMGIVHRDLKPANLFLTSRPDGSPLVKVLDFGIAKAQADRNFNLTQTSTVLGSPGYMSPEQLRSTKDVDRRSDIWSIGVILYELVSGRPPFTGESITELALHIAMDPTPPLVGRMPNGFEQVVNRCLAKDPAQRYPDLANLAHALAAYGGPVGWEYANTVSRLLNQPPRMPTGPAMAPTIVPGSRPQLTPPFPQPGTPTTMGSAASSMVTTGSRGGRRWGLIAGIAGVAVAAVVVMAIAMNKSSAKEPDVAAPPPPAAADAAVVQQTVPDAAVPMKAAPDAAAPAPVDAGVPDAPIDAAPKKHVPHTTNNTTKPPQGSNQEDVGESRF